MIESYYDLMLSFVLFVVLFISCIWFKKILLIIRIWLIEIPIFGSLICAKLLLILAIIAFIFRVIWLIPCMIFISHVFISLEERIAFVVVVD